MSRQVLIALTTGLCLAAVAGCSGGGSGQTPAPTSASATAAPSSSKGQAPAITQPKLDAAKWDGRTCELLTSAQTGQLRVTKPGKARSTPAGETCNWTVDASPGQSLTGSIGVNLNSKTEGGLNKIYADRSTYKHFEETTVAGYPSAHTNESVPFDSGDCGGVTGVNDNVILNVVVLTGDQKAPEYKAPCALADKVAEMVISTMKGGS
ncbi:DUF3558 domain-containing protein [Crossiella sp. CA-258035]|uniref:DUF3558 domain-containing protein n=1 Tax=Crossiella sp. CA-258035 TaxID=2981138 RepID=UPI0024BC942C|nr:DUF3558 domain-containing protein [Crossiella sp. CA-258035]WHT20760.1 DUF3558 domain-containing protein [Crossiella sp. CA-258035]